MAIIAEDKIEEVSPPSFQSNTSDDRHFASTPGLRESGDTARKKDVVSSEKTFEDAVAPEELKNVYWADSRNIFGNLN